MAILSKVPKADNFDWTWLGFTNIRDPNVNPTLNQTFLV